MNEKIATNEFHAKNIPSPLIAPTIAIGPHSLKNTSKSVRM